MSILHHGFQVGNLATFAPVLPLGLVDDFDAPLDGFQHYEPTQADIEALNTPPASQPIGDWLLDQVAYHQSQATAADRWLAVLLVRLASLATYTKAQTGEDLDARVAVLDLNRTYRLEPAENLGRSYGGYDLRDAAGTLVGYYQTLSEATTALEAYRSIDAYLGHSC